MKNKYRLYLTVFLFMMTNASFVNADTRFSKTLSFSSSRDESASNMAEIYDRLNLTDEQKTKLEESRQENHQKIKEIKEIISSLKEELQQELENKDLNKEHIDEIQAELSSLEAQLNELRIRGVVEVREILTPEQYAIFNEISR